MPEEEQYITKEKKEQLQEELVYLTTKRRKEVAEQLDYAKSLGDLSENAEYHQARQDQAMLEDRIREIEGMLKYAQVIDHKKSDVVEVGSTVEIRKSRERKTREFTIVGKEESDMATARISNLSPLAQAMLGKKKGEKFTFKTPAGEDVTYTIEKVK